MLVNGKEFSIQNLSQKNISSILIFFGISIGTVAVEKNGEIVSKDLYETTTLGESDKLEIIKFVGGG